MGKGPTRPVLGDDSAMERKLPLLTPGVYRVRWTSVSTVDGHTLQGSYSFGVGTSAAGDERLASGPLDSEGLLGLAGRFAGLVGLALWAGLTLLAGRAAAVGVPPARLARLARGSPLLVFAGMALSALSSAVVATGSPFDLSGVLLQTGSGRLRLVLLAAAALGALAGWRWRPLSGVLVGVALVAEAGSGHAAGSPAPLLATASFAAHLAAVGVWVFAITASVLASERLVAALRAFTPAAVTAAVAVGLTGLANSFFELGHPGDLLSTGYGLALLAKTAAFAAMAGLGYTHYRWRRQPRPSPTRLAVPLRAELGAAGVALVLATTLVGFPNPPREAEAGEEVVGTDPVLGQLASREAVSVAEPTGPFVVGLTLLPARPGPIEARVQVTGVEAGDGLRRARLRGTTAEGASVELGLAPCGLGCFAGHGHLPAPGAWRFEIGLATNRGPIAVTTTLDLPAADGRAALEQAIRAMEGLRSARLTEELRGSQTGPLVKADYAFRAPDGLAFTVGSSSQQVFLGRRTWSRRDAAGPWEPSTSPEPGFRWPADYYRSFWASPAAVRVLGTAEVSGVATTVLAFVRPDVLAWFRLWVGAQDGLVHRMEMVTEGHLMDHRYEAFDTPVDISPPT